MPLTPKKVTTGAAAAAMSGLLIVGGATLANAAAEPAPTSGSSSDRGQRTAHEHTTVTGEEANKVSAAVTAKDSSLSVTEVLKDPDGSYDVTATKDGARVRLEVSADLATITERTAGPRGGARPDGSRGEGSGSGRAERGTVVSGDEASKVSAAVTAMDSSVTVTEVRKKTDGSYRVTGTRDGSRVRFAVSADLATITERTGGPADGSAPSDGRPERSSSGGTSTRGADGAQPTPQQSASPSSNG